MARKKAAAEATTKPRGAPPSQLGTILIVEDDAVLSMAIEAALLDAGAAGVHVCSTASDALAVLREHKPDGMVLDVHLADRDDGWAIAELVSEVGPHPPRIVFSTGAPGDIPAQIAELGLVLEKPYSFAELIELLRKPPRAGLLSRLRGALNP